jgi:opacity protein-like surface antigen
MRLQLNLRVMMAALLAATAVSGFAQTVPTATGKAGLNHLTVGAGISYFKPDFDNGEMLGGTVWANFFPNWVPRYVRGIGVALEARDINYYRSTTQPANLRQDTAQGGLIYSWSRFSRIRPYAKFLAGLGNTDYESTITHKRYNDGRTIMSVGGGVDYRITSRIWARGDYEYQRWPNFFFASTPPGDMNPQGFTGGVSYDIGKLHWFSK